MSSPDGRPLLPLRLGSSYAIAGVNDHAVRRAAQAGHHGAARTGRHPRSLRHQRTTAADRWDQATELIHRHVASLKRACDQDRAARGLKPLRMLGVGIEVGSPVYNGEVMPHLSDGSAPPVALAAALHRLFEADPDFGQAVPVIVENDVNALAVLAIHQAHYAEPDLVVVGVFDEGVGGGLVMDGRLRRGGNGRAMEIGHLAVGFPPGQQERQPDPQEPGRGARRQGSPISAPDAGAATSGMSTPSHRRAASRECSATSPWTSSARSSSRDPRFKEAQDVFARSGAALGRALAHVSNTVNPSRIITYLPAPLAEPKPDTAAAAYRSAMRPRSHQRIRGRRQGRIPDNPPAPRQARRPRPAGSQSRGCMRPGKLHRARAAA